MKSATTEPSYGMKEWITILHNAAAVPQSHPRYGEARQVIEMAKQGLADWKAEGNAQDMAPQQTGIGTAVLRNAAQGATSGFADEIIGRLMAAHGDGDATNVIRDQLAESRGDHPWASVAGNVAGSFANPLDYLLRPVTQGLTPAAQWSIYGGAFGGAQGLGEGQGSLGDRAPLGIVGGVGGALAGAVSGKVLGKATRQIWQNVKGGWPAVRSLFQRTEAAVAKTLGPDAAPATVQQVTEAAHRAYLQKQNFPPHVVDQLMDTWRVGGKLPVKPPTIQPPVEPSPPILRPGETVTPAYPGTRGGISDLPREGAAISGPRTTPPEGSAKPNFWEEVYGTPVRDLGKGQTLPYYPRGGSVEQGMAPLPQNSMPNLAPNQNQAFADFLKGATPQDLGARVGTLRALGIPLPENAEAELLAYLSGAR